MCLSQNFLSVLTNVLKRTHRFEGCQLNIRRYYQCLGVVPVDHNLNVLKVPLPMSQDAATNVEEDIQQRFSVNLHQLKQQKRSPLKEVSRLIEVTWAGTSSPSVQEDLYLCFENKRVSGGGPIEKLTFDEQDCVALIQFARPAGNYSSVTFNSTYYC